ncbi:MAG: zinc ribbon domain-containing protein [Cephaloticoccus sp.]|nr:zinc ribbon domain-containing protein [Cephaloticoccus sp.]MCF7759276.1 zinc ribbon domain-containing protein [Cephaloticoccus sp.]
MSRDFTPPHECPVCGEAVPRGAKACPGCGADERSGWDDDATCYDGLDLPDEAYDDEKEVQSSPPESHVLRTIVIVSLIGALLLLFVFR